MIIVVNDLLFDIMIMIRNIVKSDTT